REETAIRRVNRERLQGLQELTFGSRQASQGLINIGKDLVNTAAQFETYSATLKVVEGSAEGAASSLKLITDATLELVGIETGDLISFFSRFRAVGLDAKTSISAISGVTKAVAEQGKPAFTTARILEQLSQALNSGKIEGQDLRPVMRELPQLFKIASASVGEQVSSLEEWREAARRGKGERQALIDFMLELDRTSQGADLNSFNAQLDIFNDQLTLLKAELGSELLPVATDFLKFLNELVQAFKALPRPVKQGIVVVGVITTGLVTLASVVGTVTIGIISFTTAVKALIGTSALGGVAKTAASAGGGLKGLGSVLSGLGGSITKILGPIRTLGPTAAKAFTTIGTQGTLAATAITTLITAWTKIYDAFQINPPFEDAVSELKEFELANSQTAKGLGLTEKGVQDLAAGSKASVTDIKLVTERMDQLRKQIVRSTNDTTTNVEEVKALRKEYQELLKVLQELREEQKKATTAPNVPTPTAPAPTARSTPFEVAGRSFHNPSNDRFAQAIGLARAVSFGEQSAR
ncbi:MAG: tape measure protein, partial [Chloroflexi bacterium]|nr:tape measure protein [Chloroflexota bacterium]